MLVNAGSVEQKEFQNSEKSYITNDLESPSYVLSYCNAHEELAIGSSFKPISVRIFEQYDEIFSPKWSIYNNSFDDISTVNIENVVISNWDINSNTNPINYYTYYDNEVYHRSSGLADAFINSSNTYFLCHAYQMGLVKYKDMLDNIFQLYHQYDIGDRYVAGLQFTEADPYVDVELPYGQSAVISPVRLASVYNHAIGGKFYLPFEIAQIRTPDNEIIFRYQPEEISEYSLDIDVNHDIVANGLEDIFLSYIQRGDGTYYPMFDEFSAAFLGSERLLAKSGTAVIDTSTDNRTMAITLLNQERNAVVCTAVIALKYVDGNSVTNAELIHKILKVLEKMGVLA